MCMNDFFRIVTSLEEFRLTKQTKTCCTSIWAFFQLPKPQEVKVKLEENWNSGVKTAFTAIEESPSKIAAAITPPNMS